MDVEVVLNQDPRHVGIGGHGLVDVGHVVGLGACGADRFGEHIPSDNVPVADQGGGAVARVLEFLFGDLVHARWLVGSVAFEGLQARHLVGADRPRAIGGVPGGGLAIGFADLTHTVREHHRILLRRVQPHLSPMRLQDCFF